MRAPPRAAGSALIRSLIWGSLLLSVSLTSLFLMDSLPAPEMAPRGKQRLQQRRAQERLAAEETQSAATKSRSDEEETARTLFNRTFPSGWKASGTLEQLRHEEVMRVRPPEGTSEAEFRASAPYYLRGLVLAEFEESGAQAAIPAALPMFADEDGDGWVRLSDSPASKSDPREIELLIEQVPLIVRRGAWNVLFAPRPLHAVRAQRVLFHEDALLAFPATEEEERTVYATRSADLRFDRDCPSGRNTGTPPNGGWTALPPPSPTLRLLKKTAEEWTVGSRSDEERVQRIVDRFRADFAYAAISADVPGLKGIRNFLELERGYCTYFAAGATLLLRTLGVPARVATGFVAEQWDEEAGAFVVTTQNGHAWTEVWFEGLGWLRVEPTPSRRRLRALGRLSDGPAGLREWATTFGSDLRFLALSGARSADVGALRDTVGSLPVALARSVRARPWAFGLGALGLAIAFGWRGFLRQRRGRENGEMRTPRGRAAGDLERQFRSALYRRGAPGDRTLTLREMSRSVGEGEELAEELARLRFGGEAAAMADGLHERVGVFCQSGSTPP